MNKKLLFKLLLVISFIPFIYSLIMSFIAMFSGANLGLCVDDCPTVFGIKAFVNDMFLYLSFLTLYGILPVCVLYQIIYLVKYIKNKRV